MKNTGLLIAAVVLAALSGVLYWSNHHPAGESTTKASSDVAPKILSLNQDDITKISIQKKEAEETDLIKDASGKWQITAPKPLGADKEAVSSLLYAVSSLNSDRLVDEKPSDLTQYGLKQPSLMVNVTTKDNKTHEVLLGDSTPTGSDVFAKLEGDPRIFTIASYNKNSLDKGVGDLRDKRLLPADFDKVSQIELITKKQDLTFARNKEDWQILKPKPLRADNFKISELVDKLKDAKMETSATDADAKKVASSFAAGSPVAIAKVTDASGTQELQVRKNKNDYYAKSTAVAGVYKVPSDVGIGLDKTLDDFRNKKLFDFGYDDPNNIELHDGAKAYFLTKGGQEWWSDGKKMDSSSVQSLIDKVRGLSATKFPESGFSSPALELTVVSNEGKRTEKVSIAKSGDHYIAKRENEPSLYELDSSSITDLQKAAADVKVAAAPEPAKPSKK
jgi:hypothetical protein